MANGFGSGFRGGIQNLANAIRQRRQRTLKEQKKRKLDEQAGNLFRKRAELEGISPQEKLKLLQNADFIKEGGSIDIIEGLNKLALQRSQRQNVQSQKALREAQATALQPKSAADKIREFNIELDQKAKLGELKRSGDLRRELTTSPIFKDFQVLKGSSRKIDVALKDALRSKGLRGKAIADQALIVMFNKIIDPNSVVRESEFARTPQGLSAINRIKGFAEKVAQGSVGITDQERNDISRVAKILLNVSGELFNQELDRFGLLADELKVGREKVLIGIKRFNPSAIGASTGTLDTPSGISFSFEEVK